jgi:hypothetical protein
LAAETQLAESCRPDGTVLVGCTYSIFLQIGWIGYAAEFVHSTPYREPIEQLVVNVFRPGSIVMEVGGVAVVWEAGKWW